MNQQTAAAPLEPFPPGPRQAGPFNIWRVPKKNKWRKVLARRKEQHESRRLNGSRDQA